MNLCGTDNAFGLVELDGVATRVVEKRLQTFRHEDRLGDLYTGAAQLGNYGIHFTDRKSEVLAQIWWSRCFDQVHLLISGVQPGSAEPEVRPVGALGQSQYLCVELKGARHIRDVYRHVVQTEWFH